MPGRIDINCDCGESFGNWSMGADEALMPLITTANVACGFHGGDPLVMQRTVADAHRNGVAVGAHPGLPDLVGFGRRRMDISPAEAYAAVVYQVGALKGFLAPLGMTLHHVKPHGALYGMLNDQDDLAAAVAEAIRDTCPSPLLYWPAPVERHAL
ncbi:MAG: 5-oxoprolinase subunit PxpA, partial [Bauldia litoralis]